MRCFRNRTLLLLGCFLPACSVSLRAAAAGEHVSTIAGNDDVRVLFGVNPVGQRLVLEVRDAAAGKTLWRTQPSSSKIRVNLRHRRIVIFTKTRNPGRLDFDKSGPTRGGKMYTLRGKQVGEISGKSYRGVFVGSTFLAVQAGGGIAAYRCEDAKQLWFKKELSADFITPLGSGLVNFRKAKSTGWYNSVVDVSTGKLLFETRGTGGENPDILLADRSRYVTLKTCYDGADGVSWRSEVLTAKGGNAKTIQWTGMPYKAVFSRDGKKIAAVCVLPESKKDKKPPRLIAVLCNLEGEVLARRELVDLLPKQAYTDYVPQLACDSHSLVVTLKRKYPPITWREAAKKLDPAALNRRLPRNGKGIVKLQQGNDASGAGNSDQGFAKFIWGAAGLVAGAVIGAIGSLLVRRRRVSAAVEPKK